MDSRKIIFRIILIIFMIFTLAVSDGESKKKLVFSIGPWAPYTGEQLPEYGLLCRLVKNVFKEKDIDVEFRFMPWKRALIQAENNIVDGTFGWTKTEERSKQFFYSNLLFESRCVFFHLKTKQIEWNSISDLKGLRVGGTIGYNYGEAFQQAEENGLIFVERAESDIQNFKKLLSGRIDIFPQLLEVGCFQLKNNFSIENVGRVTYHKKPYRTGSYYLLMSRKNADNKKYVDIFNSVLQDFNKSDVSNTILDCSKE